MVIANKSFPSYTETIGIRTNSNLIDFWTLYIYNVHVFNHLFNQLDISFSNNWYDLIGDYGTIQSLNFQQFLVPLFY